MPAPGALAAQPYAAAPAFRKHLAHDRPGHAGTGKAMQLAGDGRIEIADSADLLSGPGDSFTVQCWFRVSILRGALSPAESALRRDYPPRGTEAVPCPVRPSASIQLAHMVCRLPPRALLQQHPVAGVDAMDGRRRPDVRAIGRERRSSGTQVTDSAEPPPGRVPSVWTCGCPSARCGGHRGPVPANPTAPAGASMLLASGPRCLGQKHTTTLMSQRSAPRGVVTW